MPLTPEKVVKDAASDLIQTLRQLTQSSADELQELSLAITTAFEIDLLMGNPQAEELLKARIEAMVELGRLTAVQAKKEVVLASITTAIRVVRTVLLSL